MEFHLYNDAATMSILARSKLHWLSLNCTEVIELSKACELRVSISSFFAVLFCFGAAAQDARFKPASLGVTLDNPSYLVDFSASGTARWVHYELLGGETSRGRKQDGRFPH